MESKSGERRMPMPEIQQDDLPLRRCPHCGCTAVYKSRVIGMFKPCDTYWRAECTKCGCCSEERFQEESLKDGGWEARLQAAAIWNRRTSKSLP